MLLYCPSEGPASSPAYFHRRMRGKRLGGSIIRANLNQFFLYRFFKKNMNELIYIYVS